MAKKIVEEYEYYVEYVETSDKDNNNIPLDSFKFVSG